MTDTPDGESVPLSEWERYQHSEELKSLTAENAKLKKALLAAEKQSSFAYSVAEGATRCAEVAIEETAVDHAS